MVRGDFVQFNRGTEMLSGIYLDGRYVVITEVFHQGITLVCLSNYIQVYVCDEDFTVIDL